MMSALTKYQGICHMVTGETYVKEIASNFLSSKYLKEEAISELWLYLSGLADEKFLFLFNSGQMRWYVYGFFKNQIRSKNSKFYRTYIRPDATSDELKPHHITEHDNNLTDDNKELLEIIEEAMDTLDFYRKELFRLYYFESMSYQQISDYTARKQNGILRIPKNSIWHAVTSAKRDIIAYIKQNYPDAFDENLF